MKLVLKFILLVIIVFPSYGKSLGDFSANEAYQKGKELVLHLKIDKAMPYLKYAADNGNTNAMVRYAYLISSSRLFLSPEAYDYMLKAAKNGHEWAMFSVSDEMLTTEKDKKYWRKNFLDKMQPYIDKNNPDALYLMSKFKQGDEGEREDWLIKAVDAGSCKATVDLYWFYKQGDGWFLMESRRKNREEELVKRANKLGCGEGKSIYIWWLEHLKEYDKAWKIRKTLIDSGDANSIIDLANDYLPSIHNGYSILPADYEKAAIYFKIYIEGFGKVSGLKDVYDSYIYDMDRSYAELTDKQKKYVDSYVKEYLSTHDIKVRDTIWETKFN